VPKIARLQQERYVPCMAFFNYVNPWPETTQRPLRCSAPGDGMSPCGRADFAVRKFRVAPRASYARLDRLPARFRAGRSGCPPQKIQNAILVHYGLVLYDRNHWPLGPNIYAMAMALKCTSQFGIPGSFSYRMLAPAGQLGPGLLSPVLPPSCCSSSTLRSSSS
jgi:hypothetical protein